MPAFIHRIAATNGKEYELGKEWPGGKPDEKVGLIFYRPQLAESVIVQNESGEDDDSVSAEETQAAYYEVWRVSDAFADQLNAVFKQSSNMEQVAQSLMEMDAIIRRTVYASNVAEVDEVWPPTEALPVIMERTVEVFAGGQVPQQQTEQPQQTSNGAQPTA